jgi:hypothetical protein
MNTTKAVLITVVVVLLLSAPLYIIPTYHFSKCTYIPNQIVITDPGKTSETKHNKPPTTPIKDCGDLEIEGSMLKNNNFGVICKNGCDSASRTFGLTTIKPKYKQHTIQLAYGPACDVSKKNSDTGYLHNLGAAYLFSWRPASIGLGFDFIFSKEKIYNFSPKIIFQYKIDAGE